MTFRISERPTAHRKAAIHIQNTQLRDLVHATETPGEVLTVHENAVVKYNVRVQQEAPTTLSRLSFNPTTLSYSPSLNTQAPSMVAVGGPKANLLLLSLPPPSSSRAAAHDSSEYTNPHSPLYDPSKLSGNAVRKNGRVTFREAGPVATTSIPHPGDTIINSVAFAPLPTDTSALQSGRERRLLVSSNEKSVRIYRIAKRDYPSRGFGAIHNGIVGVREEAFAYFDTCINHASVTPDGRTLLTAGDAPFLYLHSLSSLPQSPFPPPSSNSSASTGSYPRPIRTVRQDFSRPLKPIHTIPTSTLYPASEGNGWNGDDSYSEAICSTAFSEDGWKFAAGSQDGVVQVWDIRCLKRRLAMFHTMPSSLESRSFAARSAGNLSATYNNMGKTWGVRCLRFMPSSSLGHLGASTPQFGDRELLVVSQHHSTVHFFDARTFDTSPSGRTSIFLPDIVKQYPTSLYSSLPPLQNWSQITGDDVPLSRKRKRTDSDGSDTEVERKRREILEAEPIGSGISSLRETLAHNLEHDETLRSYADEMGDETFLPGPTFGIGGDTAPSSVLMPSPRSAISVFDSPIEPASVPIVSFDGPIASTSDAGESSSSIQAVENASSTLDGNTVGATVGESQSTTGSPEPDRYQTPQPLPDDVHIGGHNSGNIEGEDMVTLDNDLSRRTDEVMESSGQLARRLRVMNSRLRDLVSGEPEPNGNPGPSTLSTRRTIPSHLSSARSVRHSPYRYPRPSSSTLTSSLYRPGRAVSLGDGSEPSLPRMPTRDRVETLRQERGFFALQDLSPLERHDGMGTYEEDEAGDTLTPLQGPSSGRRDTPSFARDLTRGVMSQWSADSSLDPVISAGHAARRARWRQVARNRAAREVEEQLLLAAMAVNMDEESDNWTQILEELPAGGIHDLTAISDHSEMDVEVETGSGEETIDAEDVPETNAGRLSEALGFNQPATSGSANWGESENLWHSSQSRAGDWESWPLRLPPTSPLPNPPVRQSSTRGLDSSIVDQSTNPPIPRTFGLASRLSSLRELNRRTTHLPSAYHTPPEPTNGFASSSNAIPVLPSALPVPETNPPLFTASPEPMTTTIGSPLLLPRGLSEFRGTRRTRIFSPFPATSPAPHLNSEDFSPPPSWSRVAYMPVRARPFADRIFGGTFFGGQSFSSPLFDEDEDDHDYLDMNEMQTDGEERLEIAGFDFGLPGTESEGVLFVGIGNPLRSSGTKNQSRLLEFDMTRSYSVPGKEETEAKDDLPRGYRVGIGRRYAQGDFA